MIISELSFIFLNQSDSCVSCLRHLLDLPFQFYILRQLLFLEFVLLQLIFRQLHQLSYCSRVLLQILGADFLAAHEFLDL